MILDAFLQETPIYTRKWAPAAGHLQKQKDLLEAARTLEEEQTGRVNPDLLVDLGNAYGQLGHHGNLAEVWWTYFGFWGMANGHFLEATIQEREREMYI